MEGQIRRGKGTTPKGDGAMTFVLVEFLICLSFLHFYIRGRPVRNPHCEFHETVVQWAGNHFSAVGRPDSTPA